MSSSALWPDSRGYPFSPYVAAEQASVGRSNGAGSPCASQAAASYSTPTGVRINDGCWRHLAVTSQVASGSLRVHVDGIEILASTPTGNAIVAGGTLMAGQGQSSVGGGMRLSDAFDGLIDDLRICGRVLSQEEIKALSSMGR